MITIENIMENIKDTSELGEAQRAILHSLALTGKRTEELFRIELMNKVDNDAGESIPVKKLLGLDSTVGVFRRDATFLSIHDCVVQYLEPLLEDSSGLVTKIIPRLLAYSLYRLHEGEQDQCSTITRRYIYTDRIAIYKLELVVCTYCIPCPILFPDYKNVYCIVGSKSTVDVNRIGFTTLAHFYQRQLSAHGIDKRALKYLFYEFKDTYHKLAGTNSIPYVIERRI